MLNLIILLVFDAVGAPMYELVIIPLSCGVQIHCNGKNDGSGLISLCLSWTHRLYVCIVVCLHLNILLTGVRCSYS